MMPSLPRLRSGRGACTVEAMRRLTALALLAACTSRGVAPMDDAAMLDASGDHDASGIGCGCAPGPHTSHIYLMSDDGALWSYDPVADTFALVVGPACATTDSPYSMAVDGRGRAFIEYAGTRRVSVFDLLAPGACVDSGYLPTNATFPLFGMGFFARDARTECATLYAQSFSGASTFAEGPGLGALGVVEGSPLAIRTLAPLDYDGGELAGTGDGRLFAFTGVHPSKLVELDPSDGHVIEILPLAGLPTTNANAFAFFGGDFFFFTEALPTGCDACLDTQCAPAHAACSADATCSEQLTCAIVAGHVTDTCGGGAGTEMLDCLGRCSAECLTSSRTRVSQVTRLDWDRSDGPDRALTVVRTDAPIRVVGAGTSPCVPTVPF